MEVEYYRRWCYGFIILILLQVLVETFILSANASLHGRNLDLSKQVEALKDGCR